MLQRDTISFFLHSICKTLSLCAVPSPGSTDNSTARAARVLLEQFLSHQDFPVLPSLFCVKSLLCNVMPSKRASGNRSPVSWFRMLSLRTIYNPGLFGSSTSVRKTSSWHRESVSSLVKYVPGFQFEFIFCFLCFSLLYPESFNVIFSPEDNFILWTSYHAIIKTYLNLY